MRVVDRLDLAVAAARADHEVVGVADDPAQIELRRSPRLAVRRVARRSRHARVSSGRHPCHAVRLRIDGARRCSRRPRPGRGSGSAAVLCTRRRIIGRGDPDPRHRKNSRALAARQSRASAASIDCPRRARGASRRRASPATAPAPARATAAAPPRRRRRGSGTARYLGAVRAAPQGYRPCTTARRGATSRSETANRVIAADGQPAQLEPVLGARARRRPACAAGVRPGSASPRRARAGGAPPARRPGGRDAAG